MRFEVRLTAGAERDLENLHSYIAETDSTQAANRVLDRLLKVVRTLEAQPTRGSRLRELEGVEFGVYRQILLHPWRLVNRAIGSHVFIYLIVDGRRDLRSVLAQRLLSS
jgi:toxin ParE1/3/4